MPPAVITCVLFLGIVAVLGVVATLAGPQLVLPRRVGAFADRVQFVLDAAAISVGRLMSALVVLFAGFGVTLVTCYLLGKGAYELESSVDWPAFIWFRDRQLPGTWTHLWNVLTQIGNRSKTQPLDIAGAVVLTGLWARSRRRWWIPLTMLPLGYLFEKLGQMFIKLTVHRGHPPTTLGTWPSGGCARLIVVVGLIFYLALRWKGASKRVWWGAWSLLAFLAAVEAYSRTYLLKHWITDVAGGLIYGAMALLAVIATIAVLDRRSPVHDYRQVDPSLMRTPRHAAPVSAQRPPDRASA